jgi:hypothetical protein
MVWLVQNWRSNKCLQFLKPPELPGGLAPLGPLYFNPSKNYWFSFIAFLVSLIGLYFRCLSFRVVLVNTARPVRLFQFFFHQNQNIFFSNIGNQNIFLEKNHNLQVKWSFPKHSTSQNIGKPNNLKKILNETKNHNPPPLQVKWSVP